MTNQDTVFAEHYRAYMTKYKDQRSTKFISMANAIVNLATDALNAEEYHNFRGMILLIDKELESKFLAQ